MWCDKCVTLPSLVKVCPASHLPRLHCAAVKSGFSGDTVLSNSLISAYSKTSFSAAHKVFDEMPDRDRDTISWNSIVNSCIVRDSPARAFRLLARMHSSGFVPNPELLAATLSSCNREREPRLGLQIHGLSLTHPEIEASDFLSTALLHFYFTLRRSPNQAFHIFDTISNRNHVTWTALISGCVSSADYAAAMHCLRAMQIRGSTPNRVTLISVLPACSSTILGKEIHAFAIRRGFHADPRFSAALLRMYCKCGDESIARLVFEASDTRDVVMWSSMIENTSNGREAVKLFNRMQYEGTLPNSVTLLALVSTSVSLSSTELGSQVHARALKSGLGSRNVFLENALINMYSKCGCVEAARRIFAEMASKDFVSWSTMIDGLGVNGLGREALQIFRQMQKEQVEMDGITFLAIIGACGRAGMVEEGHRIFQNLVQSKNSELSVEHYAAYVDMLGRSGKIDFACEIVGAMPMEPSPAIWTSLVSNCKLHGRLDMAELVAYRLIESDPDNSANYTLLGLILTENGNWRGVEQIRTEMRRRRLNKRHGFSRQLTS